MRKKHPFTLLEIMIVIFLITLITGAVAYNMRGSLDRGKAFRTERAQEQLQDLLLLALNDNPNEWEEIVKRPVTYLRQTGLARDPEALLKDGWGQPFALSYDQKKGEFKVVSESLEKYNRRRQAQVRPRVNNDAQTQNSDEDEAALP